jgi:antigen flippase
VLSGSSLVTILAGVVTSKVAAVKLGPSGLGLLALLQGVVALGSIIASVGVGSAVVRFGAQAIAAQDEEELARTWTGAWALFWAVTVPAAVLIFLFRSPVAAVLVGGRENSAAVGWISPALVFSLAGALNGMFINAHQRVSLLARLAIYGAFVQTTSTVAIILSLGRAGIPFAILSGSVITWAISRWLLVRHLGKARTSRLSEAKTMVRSLVAFGAPYTLGAMVTSGAQVLLPVMVVTFLDEANVGYARAAWAIGVTYLGFLLSGMSQDYYPRLAAAAHDHDRMNRMVNRQLDVMYLIATPIIFLGMALARFGLPILYSGSFAPAAGILEWQLVGDVFKLTSWALAFTILARGRTVTYLAVESIGGVLLLGTAVPALKLLGVSGVGVGYAVTYLLYCGVVYVVVRGATGFHFTSDNLRKLIVVSVGVAAVKAIFVVTDNPWAHLLPGVVGGIVAVRSFRRGLQLWRVGDVAE